MPGRIRAREPSAGRAAAPTAAEAKARAVATLASGQYLALAFRGEYQLGVSSSAVNAMRSFFLQEPDAGSFSVKERAAIALQAMERMKKAHPATFAERAQDSIPAAKEKAELREMLTLLRTVKSTGALPSRPWSGVDRALSNVAHALLLEDELHR